MTDTDTGPYRHRYRSNIALRGINEKLESHWIQSLTESFLKIDKSNRRAKRSTRRVRRTSRIYVYGWASVRPSVPSIDISNGGSVAERPAGWRYRSIAAGDVLRKCRCSTANAGSVMLRAANNFTFVTSVPFYVCRLCRRLNADPFIFYMRLLFYLRLLSNRIRTLTWHAITSVAAAPRPMSYDVGEARS